jgi:hypothetical protein
MNGSKTTLVATLLIAVTGFALVEIVNSSVCDLGDEGSRFPRSRVMSLNPIDHFGVVNVVAWPSVGETPVHPIGVVPKTYIRSAISYSTDGLSNSLRFRRDDAGEAGWMLRVSDGIVSRLAYLVKFLEHRFSIHPKVKFLGNGYDCWAWARIFQIYFESDLIFGGGYAGRFSINLNPRPGLGLKTSVRDAIGLLHLAPLEPSIASIINDAQQSGAVDENQRPVVPEILPELFQAAGILFFMAGFGLIYTVGCIKEETIFNLCQILCGVLLVAIGWASEQAALNLMDFGRADWRHLFF